MVEKILYKVHDGSRLIGAVPSREEAISMAEYEIEINPSLMGVSVYKVNTETDSFVLEGVADRKNGFKDPSADLL